MPEILNQPPPLADFDLFASDRALCEGVAREGADWASSTLSAFGWTLGRPETLALGEAANAWPPRLKTFDRFGHRIDKVTFHPAWHALMALQVGGGLHASPWADPRPGAQVARAAGLYMACQVEAGSNCPISMTFASAPVLRQAPEIARDWLPRLFSRTYDKTFAPAERKAGALVGMGMTENQGGSDLRANTTRARPAGDHWRIDGAKWFFSAPMCDAFLVLAQSEAGPTCFFMPRWTPAGELNGIRLQRLKDKLGNRSNASAEVVFEDAYAAIVGEEGRGIPTIIEMAALTRLDNVVSSAGLQRAALAHALHHARYRTVFQRKLIDQPLMTAVLADLVVEVEAATALALRLARALDHAADPAEAALARLVTPAAKFWVCKRGPILAAEALEVLGGNGYIEESGLPRLYREAPVNSIWEGSGNVMALDARRALAREPACLEALAAELEPARGENVRLDAAIEQTLALAAAPGEEAGLRRLCGALVLTLQGALLARHAPPFVADAFCSSRLHGGDGRVFGDLPGANHRAIVGRGAPII